jgi:hypothetical protein
MDNTYRFWGVLCSLRFPYMYFLLARSGARHGETQDDAESDP